MLIENERLLWSGADGNSSGWVGSGSDLPLLRGGEGLAIATHQKSAYDVGKTLVPASEVDAVQAQPDTVM